MGVRSISEKTTAGALKNITTAKFYYPVSKWWEIGGY